MNTTKTINTNTKMNKTESKRPEMTLTAEEKTAWIEMYNTKRKLPSLRVPCSRTGQGVVMFADNLHARVIAYGGIENLLNNFVCREAKAADAKRLREQLDTIRAERRAARIAAREERINELSRRKAEKVKKAEKVEKVETKPVTIKKKSSKKTEVATANNEPF